MLEPIPIAALNQYIFCPRRCALMYIEGIWRDNEHTVLGTLLHDHADKPGYENIGRIKILRALPIYSQEHNIVGKADIVEVQKGKYTPIEYKKGKQRKFDNDEIQLCAQTLCLEEMFKQEIPEGYIYHASSKQRRKVTFNQQLRQETFNTIKSVSLMLEKEETPLAELRARCRGCSLRNICLPELTDPNYRVKKLNLSF